MKNPIIVTGAAGFIASNVVERLNQLGEVNIVLVDEFDTKKSKFFNWFSRTFRECINRNESFLWDVNVEHSVTKEAALVIHLGARTDTTEFNYEVHERLNLEYSKKVWKFCTAMKIPLIYASSAATYGDGSLGYNDDHDVVGKLQPLNPYGISKNEFDKWALQQDKTPPFWYGLKFFNVYGPNEAHKERMASVVLSCFNQICNSKSVKLFKSHRPDYQNGQQLRDFVYVKDVVNVIQWLSDRRIKDRAPSGLYNLGTGKARSYQDLACATFGALGLEPNIEYVDMPEDIRNTYQYHTEANMQKF